MIEQDKEYTLGKAAFALFALEEMKWVLALTAFTIAVSILRDVTQVALLVPATRTLEVLTLLALVLGALWSWWKYKNITFSLQEFDLKMKSGIVIKKETSIPYRQIQSVDIVRGPMHQLLGLSELVMLTAGHEEGDKKHNGMTEVTLEPIDKHFAEDIRSALQRRIGVQIVREENVVQLDGSKQQ